MTRKVARAYAPQPANHVQGCSVNSGCGLTAVTGDAVESPVPIDAIGAWDGGSWKVTSSTSIAMDRAW